MKILFITHCHGNYGASKSLQLLIRNYKDADIDLVVPKSIREKNDLKSLREFYGNGVNSIDKFFLPFEYCSLGCPEEKLLHLKNFLKNFLWKLSKRKLCKKFYLGKYDFIHLNSTVLNPIITSDLPFVVHVREVVAHPKKKTFQKLLQARGLIFISPATQDVFNNKQIKTNSIILNNPFDMTSLGKKYVVDEILSEYQLKQQQIVFSSIGRIEESKGIKCIIEAFRKTYNPNYILLLPGKGNPGSLYEHECHKLSKGDSRIHFPGEIEDINKIYLISDYIIRGDPYHMVGRTIFEGLFAGCDVIIPGILINITNNVNLLEFKEKIHLYPAQDSIALENILNGLSYKITKKQYYSNLKEYINSFDGFVKKVLL